ncbi:hypothetical protein JXA85_07290 [Candidatus Woesearchaeota archaeon]|nr:hypothetical protein [Candidatus Woesearchaeota archaeon]
MPAKKTTAKKTQVSKTKDTEAEKKLKELLKTKSQVVSDFETAIETEELRKMVDKVVAENKFLNRKLDVLLNILLDAAKDVTTEDTNKRINAMMETQLTVANKLDSLTIALERLREDVPETHEKVESLEKQIGSLNLMLTKQPSAEKIAEVLIGEMNRKFRELEGLKAQINALGEKMMTLEPESSVEALKEVKAVEKDLDKFEVRLRDINAAVKEALPHSKKVEEISQSINALKDQITAINVKFGEIKVPEIKNVEAAIAELTQKIDAVAADVDELEARKPVDIAPLKYQIGSINARLAGLLEKTSASPEMSAVMKDELGKLTYKIDSVAHELSEFERKEIQRDLEEGKVQETHFKTILDEIRSKLTQMPPKGEKAIEGIASASESLAGIEKEIMLVEKEAANYPKIETEIKKLSLDAKVLESRLKSGTYPKSKAMSKLTQIDERLDKVLETLNKMKAKEMKKHVEKMEKHAIAISTPKLMSAEQQKAVEKEIESIEKQAPMAKEEDVSKALLTIKKEVEESIPVAKKEAEQVKKSRLKILKNLGKAKEISQKHDETVEKIQKVGEHLESVGKRIPEPEVSAKTVKIGKKAQKIEKSELKTTSVENMLEELPEPTKTIKETKLELDSEKIAQGIVGRIKTLQDEGQTKFRLNNIAKDMNINPDDAKKAVHVIKKLLGSNYKVSGGLIGKEITIEVS